MVAGSTKGLRNQFVSGRATHNQAIRICIVDMYHGFFFVHWLLLCFLHHLDMCNVSFWHRLPTCFLPHIRSSLTSFLPPSLIPSFVPFLHLLSFFLPSFLPLYRILLLSRKASFFLPSLPSVLPSFLHSILLCLLLCLPPSFYIYIYINSFVWSDDEYELRHAALQRCLLEMSIRRQHTVTPDFATYSPRPTAGGWHHLDITDSFSICIMLIRISLVVTRQVLSTN